MKSVVLIGHRAAGKTSVGSLLARELNLDFVDTDQWIVQKKRMSIESIFEIHGEEMFRQYEERALLELSRVNTVIACGGGTPMFLGNQKTISKRFGLCIYLDVPMQQLLERRMGKSRDVNRPVLTGYKDVSDEVYNTYTDRHCVYESLADIRYDCNRQSVENTVRGLIALLQSHRETGKD